jgi:hypothetical protein
VIDPVEPFGGEPVRDSRLCLRGFLSWALLSIVVLAAACSGSSTGPGVAGQGSSSPSPAASPSGDLREAQLAYAQCMRDHGIADFPDPDAQGHMPMPDGEDRPEVDAADGACRSLLSQPSEEEQDQGDAWLLAVAQCMREHGFSAFPDPEPGHPLNIGPDVNPELDPNNPEFQAALEACESEAADDVAR